MTIGQLNQRVRFDSPTQTIDDYGRAYSGWAAEFTVSAGYRRLRGGEAVIASRLQGKQPTVITIRNSTYAKRIKGDWRVVDVRTGEEFNIRSLIETDNRHYREITAESGVAV